MAFSTPVLFLVFNRPEHTQRVFEQIRQMQPERLFISADGPRTQISGEAERCAVVRQIVQFVDWPCTVYTNFRDENLGCKVAVREAISWFFQYVEEGIILEDDCLPDKAFFPFCTQMLEQYRYDESVMHVSGYNPFPWDERNYPASYAFSRLPFIWGWATWRRAWLRYDEAFIGLDAAWWDGASGLSRFSNNLTIRRYLLDKFQRTRQGEIDTWDYAWFYTLLMSGGKCITPAVSLVCNIGFDQLATHTRKKPAARNQAGPTTWTGTLTHPVDQMPVPALEDSLAAAVKSGWGLALRRLAPWYYFKPLPPRGLRRHYLEKFIPSWLNTILLS